MNETDYKTKLERLQSKLEASEADCKILTVRPTLAEFNLLQVSLDDLRTDYGRLLAEIKDLRTADLISKQELHQDLKVALADIKQLEAREERYKAAINFALTLEDVESMKNILEPFKALKGD